MIKTFRGLLADGEQETIRLSTNNGLMGYRIVKFQIVGTVPGTVDQESIVKIYKYEQLTTAGDPDVDGTIDFDDGTLLAVAYWESYGTQYSSSPPGPIIFESEVFNQDVYVTHKDVNTGESCNYYIELEQVKLDLSEATVATLKDMRGSN